MKTLINKNDIFPKEKRGNFISKSITKSTPRKWTKEEENWLLMLKDKGCNNIYVSKCLDRNEISIQIKYKRLKKKDTSYNSKHIKDKYLHNKKFYEIINPRNCLDLFSGEKSYWENNADLDYVWTNDCNKNFKDLTYNEDASRLLCFMNWHNYKFDLIDIDPFGSAYECFDLAIKIANKGIVITYGEIGHKRWKRLDYVNRIYGINNFDDFNIDTLIEHTVKIGFQNKKQLNPIFIRNYQNISRVYYKISDIKNCKERFGV